MESELLGYLYHQPKGALGRLKRRRLWFVFDDSTCKLYFYKTDQDMDFNHAPLGAINIRKAALSLYPEQQYQFCISTEDKEHILTAESHETMMHWLKTLQAKRDVFADKQTVQYFNEEQYQKHQAKSKPQKVTEGVEVAMEAMTRDGDIELDDKTDTYDKGREKSASVQSGTSSVEHDSCSTDSFTGISVHSEIQSDSISHSSSPDGDPQDNLTLTSDEEANSTLIPEEQNIRLKKRLKKMQEDFLSTKKELLRHQRRELAYKELLEAREKAIVDLTEHIDVLEVKQRQIDKKKVNSGPDLDYNGQKMKDKCRELQDHAIFLNSEIQKLSLLRQQDNHKLIDSERKFKDYETEIQRLKRDYVFLLQSSISIATGEGPHELQLNVFGGDVHLSRICELLEECRMTNPDLPDARTVFTEGHTDHYGNVHPNANKGITLHYICQLLHQHYMSQMKEKEHHRANWTSFLREHASDLHHSVILKNMVHRGIPAQYRVIVWTKLALNKVQDIRDVKGTSYYKSLIDQIPDSVITKCYQRQILLDLHRTMPTNIHFQDANADKVHQLQQVLEAFCIHNPEIGYCQGMNFLVATCLLFMEAELAFWCLVAIVEKYFPDNYFDRNLVGAQADQSVLKELVQRKLPLLHTHISSVDIDLSTITLNWFLAIFFDSVPFETLLRIWDCFFLEGPVVLFRFSLAIMKLHENKLLQECDTISIMRQMKSIAKLSFDVEGLVQAAFEGLEPFPERDFITKRQQFHMERLKTHFSERDKERHEREENEKLWQTAQQLKKTNVQSMEWAIEYKPGCIWICQGQQNESCICSVNVNDESKNKLPLQLESRIMCITAVNEDIILLGTLSWYLYAFCTSTKRDLWCMAMRDTVLSVNYNPATKTLFVGLADGSLAVFENLRSVEEVPSRDDVIYLPISAYPVSSLIFILQQQELWCSCGNTIHVLDISSLDQLAGFEVSTNRYDHISRMVYSISGMWVAIRGTSLLQLWDTKTLLCLLVYDIANDSMAVNNKNEDIYFNISRVTAMLCHNDELWVGTGDGVVCAYKVTDQRSQKPVHHQMWAGEEIFMRTTRRLTSKSQSLAYLNVMPSPTSREVALQGVMPRSQSFTGDYPNVSIVKRGNVKYQSCKSLDETDVIYEDQRGTSVSEEPNEDSEKTPNDVTNGASTDDTSSDAPLVLDDVVSDYFGVGNDTKTVRRQKSSSFSEIITLEPLFKHKQSENPVRCLILTRKPDNEATIISCAGCYGDAGDILEWKYDSDKNEWNQYILKDLTDSS